jgi:hypothetical protein
MAVIMAQIQKPLPLPRTMNPALSEGVEEALLKGLAKEPGDRFASCGDFTAALREAPLTAPPERAPAPAVVAPKAPRRRLFPRLALAAVLLLLLAASGVYLLARTAPPAPPAHGKLIYQAQFKAGTPDLDIDTVLGDQSAGQIRTATGAIEVACAKDCPGLGAVVHLNGQPTRYLYEAVVHFKSGTTIPFSLEGGSYRLTVDPVHDSVQYFHNGVPISSAVDVPALHSGSDFKLSLLTDQRAHAGYLDDVKIGAATDPEIVVYEGGRLGFSAPTGTGLVQVKALRVYQLT